jgi:3'-phosphoadenosine 5'-phosphosulfate sulfotransferase (PAPS reductase)/FAD synthetase
MEKEKILVMIRIRYFWQKGNIFVKSCLKMKELKDLDSKLVLSSLAVEILVKSYIATDIYIKSAKNDDIETIENKINEKFRNIGHNFIELFNNAKNLKKEMKIKSIERTNERNFLDEYRFKLYGKDLPLIFKTLEASRYGMFSTKKDILISGNRVEEDEFLNKLSKVTNEKINSVFEYLRNIKIRK